MRPSSAGDRTTTTSRATWASKDHSQLQQKTPPCSTGRRFSYTGPFRGKVTFKVSPFPQNTYSAVANIRTFRNKKIAPDLIFYG